MPGEPGSQPAVGEQLRSASVSATVPSSASSYEKKTPLRSRPISENSFVVSGCDLKRKAALRADHSIDAVVAMKSPANLFCSSRTLTGLPPPSHWTSNETEAGTEDPPEREFGRLKKSRMRRLLACIEASPSSKSTSMPS